MTEQIRRTTERNGTDGNSYRTHGKGREQAGMSWEGRRTMERVLENTVRDTYDNLYHIVVFSILYYHNGTTHDKNINAMM